MGHRRTFVLALVLVACQAAPTAAPSSQAPSPGAIATTPVVSVSPTVETAPAVRASGLELIGRLPGSLGTLAFWGELAVASVWAEFEPGPDDGFVVVDIRDPAMPRELGRFRCIASNFDVSVWEDLVVASQNVTSRGPDCAAPVTSRDSRLAFAGIRIVSIADPAAPRELTAVLTGKDGGSPDVLGSHTHTIVPDLGHTTGAGEAGPRLLVYVATGFGPGPRPAASIVEVPLRDPAGARVLGPIDAGTAGQCHDITVHLPRNLMACAAYELGVLLFDISDRERPSLITRLVDPTLVQNLEIHHSTAFSNDGTKLVLNPEIYTDPTVTLCAGGSGGSSGALAFYDITDPRAPSFRGRFQLPRPTVGHFCYAHESNIVAIAGRDVVATGWFGGGVNLVDFTDPTNPRELAHWVSDEASGGHSFAYAGYWYNGFLYAGNTTATGLDQPPPSVRGLDVLAVDESVGLGDALQLQSMNAQTQQALPAP